LLSGGLRRLPTPQPSQSLIARTRIAVAEQIAERAEQGQNRTVLILLAVVSIHNRRSAFVPRHPLSPGVAGVCDCFGVDVAGQR
jgi:hypothetical protein